jgi:hypothetical protein
MRKREFIKNEKKSREIQSKLSEERDINNKPKYYNDIKTEKIIKNEFSTKKPVFNIPLNVIKAVKNDYNYMDNQNRNRIIVNMKDIEQENNEKFVNLKDKPIFIIPIEKIKKEKDNKIKINSDKKNKINNDLNGKINININNNQNYLDTNKLVFNNYYINNNNNNNSLVHIIEQKAQFQMLKEMALNALMNPKNINNYLIKQFIDNI